MVRFVAFALIVLGPLFGWVGRPEGLHDESVGKPQGLHYEWLGPHYRPSAGPGGEATRHKAQAAASPSTPMLDFEFFRTRVQPIFLHKRKGLARCYVCHSQGTAFRLQPLSPGASSWNEEESRKNFDAARRFVNAANPMMTPLLRMPLAAEAGGIAFHPGGKHWTSTDDSEWQTMAAWVRGEK